MRLPTAPLVAAGLVGGFAVGQGTGRRDLGGAVFGLLGSAAGISWLHGGGVRRALPLAGLYVAAMGGSHPLAKRIGRWPAVGAVTAATAAAAYAAHDRR